MKTISFKNFRRFSDFPEFKFGYITILVGGNNAGKSTLAKSMMLLVDNFKNTPFVNRDPNKLFSELLPFRLDANGIHDLKIGTFARALHFDSLESKIHFGSTLSHEDEGESFKIDFELIPIAKGVEKTKEEELETTIARMSSLTIHDTKRNIIYKSLSRRAAMSIIFGFIPEEEDSVLNELRAEIDEINAKLKDKSLNLFQIQDLKSHKTKIQKLIKSRKSKNRTGRKETEIVLEYADMRYEYDPQEKCTSLLGSFIENIAKLIKNTVLTNRQNKGKSITLYLKDQLEEIFKSAEMLEWIIKCMDIHYIQAHSIEQRTQYVVYDKNDYMAQVIHRFASLNAILGTEGDVFLKRWMKKFDIGVDYSITSRDGEAYTFQIIHNNGHTENLADAGMGINQLMSILLQLATLIHRGKHYGNLKTIIIEEPEQNLHPALQSKLADLFLEIKEYYGYNLIIETHSEYLIRRTQVLVAEMNLTEEELAKQNPFKVYYFPREGVPYDMKYMPNGLFEEAFGEGFFDEAGKWTRELIRSKKR